MDIIDILREIGFVLMVVVGIMLTITFLWMIATYTEKILEELKQIKEKLDKDD